MQNPNDNPCGFNNMNLELDPRDPTPQRTIEKVVDIMQNPNNNPGGFNMNGPHHSWNQGPQMQPFPAGTAPFYPQGNFQQAPWNQPNLEQIYQRPNAGPWSNPSMFVNFHNQINHLEEAKKFFMEKAFNFDSLNDNGAVHKEVRKVKLNKLESQIRSLITSYTVGTTPTVSPPQILSLNGYRVEGAGEKLKHFDKDAKVEIINSLMNFYSFTKSKIVNFSNIRDALNGIVKEIDSTIEHQTNMLEALSTEIEIIKKEDSAESSEMVKKEALASFEELAASLRNLGLSDEEVEAKLQSIQKALL